MRGVSKFLGIVVLWVVGSTGCMMGGSPPSGPSELDAADPVSQVEQAVTGCELDCPDGRMLTCSVPCSVPDANTLICNGVTQHCCEPHGCNGACGLQNDGCGHTIDCGPCEPHCPGGQVDCCGDGVCIPVQACRRIVCDRD